MHDHPPLCWSTPEATIPNGPASYPYAAVGIQPVLPGIRLAGKGKFALLFTYMDRITPFLRSAFGLGLVFFGNHLSAQCTAQAGNPTAALCGGVALNLSGSGTGQAPLSYAWSGSPYLSSTTTAATTFNYPVPVATTQTATLTLTVTDNAGCVATDEVVVTVNPTANAALISSNAQFTVFNGVPTFYRCVSNPNALFNFDFDGNALAGSTHTLDWGDGSPAFTATGTTWPSQSHTYDQGISTLTYSIVQPNGCNSTGTYSVFVGTNPAAGIINPGSTTGCGPLTLTFPIVGWQTNTPGTIYTITLNDGTPPITYTHPPPDLFTHVFAIGSCGTTSTDGTNTYQNSFSVNLLVENPCGSSGGSVVPIVVSLAATSNFIISPNDTACVNSIVAFSSTSTGNDIQGNTCDVTPALIWSITPSVGWTIASGSAGNTNGFVGPTYDPGSWSSGSTDLGINFNAPGPYTITLVSGNTCGGDTLVRSVCIEAPPDPQFVPSVTTGCAPLLVTTDNQSTSANSCDTRFLWSVTTSGGACGSGPAWSFAGGTTATSFEPQFQFTQAGIYSIRLQGINSCGTFQQFEVVTVNAPPQVDVQDLAGICATQCVDPSVVVQDCGSAILTYDWSFPGGVPANSGLADPPQICFGSATSSTITLTVANACGSATDATTLAVGTLPNVPVISTNSPVCVGQTITLSVVPVVPGVTYTWSGPNGNAGNAPVLQIPNATAADAGVFTVVGASNGCTGPPATATVQILPAPTITVTPASGAICNGDQATFTASGAGNYQWFIGAMLVGTGPLFNTSPAITTTYTVSGNSGGCPGSATVPVTVYPVTNVNAGANQTFCDQPIAQQLNAFPSLGIWSGPNVSPGGLFTPVPDELGPVTLTYTHVDANGCTNDDDVTITVQDLTLIADAGPNLWFCQSTTAQQLQATPPGGTWVGAGPGGIFTPSTVGAFLVSYNFGIGTCATSDQVEIQVILVPTLTLPIDQELCVNASPLALAGAPVGGTWTGTAITGPPFTFDPAAAGLGPQVLTYDYTDASGCSSTAQFTITVNPIPNVQAGPDLQLCDQAIPFQLSASPPGGTWSATTMTVTPSGEITPDGVGSAVVTYTYSDGAGCGGTDQITVDIVPVTEAAFAGNDIAVCMNSGDVQLAGTPLGGAWSGPQVSASGLVSTAVAGSYTLTFSFGTATCLVQDQVTVLVNALPAVDAGDQIGICIDGSTQALTADPVGGTWTGTGVDAGGNFDPSLAQPGGNVLTYTYTNPTTGCINTDQTTATVNPSPVAGFTHDPVACANDAFPFTNTSTDAASYEWDLGDGAISFSTSPTHSFELTGNYTIQLIAITGPGCRDTISSAVDVWDVPQVMVALSADTGCGPLLVDFTNSSVGNGLSFSWEFGLLDGSTEQFPPMFSFPPDPDGSASYTISLTATNVCGVDVANAEVVVLPVPTALFGPNLDEYCSFADVPFGNASVGVPTAFEWDFGDGTGSTDPGPVVFNSYEAINDPLAITVTLVASNICGSDTATQNITILPNQVNAFFNTTPVQGCSPLTVELTQFTAGDTSFYWDLGDGNVSVQENLSHTFTQPGTYTIELFAYGCGSDIYATDVTVFPSPEVAFTITPGSLCVGEPFTFESLTPGVSGLVWDLDDQTTSTLTSLQHAYAESGTYDVTLTATLIGNGCTASLTQQVTVNETPDAAFTTNVASGCIDLEVAFENASTNADFSQWDFGDGNTSALNGPFHTYTQPGTYTIELFTESVNGCADSVTAVVVAHPLPTSVFSLSMDESCDTLALVQTINASQGAVGFQWSLGNGETSLLNQPVITYTGPDTYTITLTATNQFGCEAISSNAFTLYPAPLASFTVEPQPGCEGYPISFLNTSVNSGAYRWSLGDGTITTASFPLHEYAELGTYDVQLIAYGAGGCTDTVFVAEAVTINPRPLAGFMLDTLQSLSYARLFQNTSEGAISFSWDFDDGELSTAIHPLHVFPADGGGYTVCLVALNEFGCLDTVCQFINLPGDPNIFVPNAFTPNEDSRNDAFLPILNGFVGWNYQLLIFDRWGLPIFATTDRLGGWDGTRNGIESPVDVYVWKVVVERDGDARDFTGHVTLVR